LEQKEFRKLFNTLNKEPWARGLEAKLRNISNSESKLKLNTNEATLFGVADL
jgi:hypothetical protein